MSDPDDPVKPAPAPADVPPDRAWLPGPQPQQDGSSFGAVILFILSFLSLLSTGCFGLFAIEMGQYGATAFFLVCALVMAAVTAGFFLWAQSALRRARGRRA
jgi:hypothetical protein